MTESKEEVLEEAPVAPEEETEAPAEEAKPKKPRGGRVLASFALLVALAAGGGAGYVYYLTVYMDPLAGVDAKLSATEGSFQRTIDAAGTTQRQALDDAVAALEKDIGAEQRARVEAQEALSRTINDGMRLAPPSSSRARPTISSTWICAGSGK